MNQALLLLSEFKPLQPNFKPLPICHQTLETPDVFWSVVFVIKPSQGL